MIRAMRQNCRAGTIPDNSRPLQSPVASEAAHAGLVRLPDAPARQRIALMGEVIAQHRRALDTWGVVAVRNERILVFHPPGTQAH